MCQALCHTCEPGHHTHSRGSYEHLLCARPAPKLPFSHPLRLRPSSPILQKRRLRLRGDVACLGHALHSVAGPGFKLKVACPSRRTLRRASLYGLATQTWWTRVPGCGFCAAGSPWGGPPLGTSRAPPAQTELPCSLVPQLQAPASHTPPQPLQRSQSQG